LFRCLFPPPSPARGGPPPITTIFMTSPLMTVFETTATLPYRFRLGPASPSLGWPACGVGNSALCRLTDILSCGRLGPARPCDESAHPRIAFKVDRNHRNALQQKPGADVRFGSTPEKLDLSIRCPLHPPRPTNRRKPWSGFALRKPPTPSIQIGKVPRRGSGDDPRHGRPCACADSGFCRGIDAGHVPWRRQQSVAAQGNKGVAARAPFAAPTKEDAKTFTDPCAHLQGRGGIRSLEAGPPRPFPAPQDLSDLSVVGRSWAEVA